MNEKIFFQIMDCLRGALRMHDALVLSLQIMAWAKLSSEGKLPAELSLQGKTTLSPEELQKIWQNISQYAELGECAQAFSSSSISFSGLSRANLAACLENAERVAQIGLLGNFKIADRIASLPVSEARESLVIPEEVASFMVGLADLSAGDTIYCPYDEICQLATHADQAGGEVFIEISRNSPFPWLQNIFSASNIHSKTSDPVRSPSYIETGRLRQFDKAITFPPMGVRYDSEISERDIFSRFREPTNSGAVLIIRHVLAQTRGRAIIAVPNSVLFSTGAEKSLRDDLLSKRLIEAVIAMPPALLPNTAIPFSILVLNRDGGFNEVRFVDGADDRFFIRDGKGRSRLTGWQMLLDLCRGAGEDKAVAMIPIKDIQSKDAQLQVGRYVLPLEQKKLQEFLETVAPCELDELVTFLRPIPTASGDDGVEVMEVGAADIPDFGYIRSPQKPVYIDEAIMGKSMKQFLRPHDIVLIMKGSVGKVGIVPESVPEPGPGGWIAGKSFIILRVIERAKIDPKALYMYLSSDMGQTLLKGIVSGATIPLIQLRELQKLKVALPDMDKMQEVIETFDKQVGIQSKIAELRKEQTELSMRHWSLSKSA